MARCWSGVSSNSKAASNSWYKCVGRREGGALARFAQGIKLDQFFGHRKDRFARLGFDLFPRRAAESIECRLGAVAADVFLHHVDAVHRQIQPIAAFVLQVQKFALNTGHLQKFEAAINADAVIEMDDEIVLFELAQAGEKMAFKSASRRVRRRRIPAVRRVGRADRAARPAATACLARRRSSRCGSGTATRCPTIPVLHICALAYMSDLTLLGSAQVNHLEERKHLMVASLDHAMWFMRPFRADEWLLYDQSSPSACGGRSLTQGKIFNQYGEMVAAVMQEGLTRYKRDFTPPTE